MPNDSIGTEEEEEEEEEEESNGYRPSLRNLNFAYSTTLTLYSHMYNCTCNDLTKRKPMSIYVYDGKKISDYRWLF